MSPIRAFPADGKRGQAQRRGIAAAFLSAVFLGTAPIFGKQAYALGMAPIELAAWRTLFAAAGLWLVYAGIGRKYFYIYPAGLIGCVAAGSVNGLGSLLYYTGLQRVDAGIGQMVYSLYPLFLVVFLRLDGHRFSALTMLRIALALVAVVFLSQRGEGPGVEGPVLSGVEGPVLSGVEGPVLSEVEGPVDAGGLALMLGASVMYAMHLALVQRVSYEMPAQTLTLYSLTAMAVVVGAAYGLSAVVSDGAANAWPAAPLAWGPTLGLAFVTLVSRLGVFFGVKRLGSLQTALIGITEILVKLLLALSLLSEALSPRQWVGAGLLIGSLLLIGREPALGMPLRRRAQAGEKVASPASAVGSSK